MGKRFLQDFLEKLIFIHVATDRGQEVSWRNKKQQLSVQKRQIPMFQASHVQQDPVLALYVTFKEEIILLFPSPNGRKCAPFYLPLVLPYRLRQVETVFHHHKAKKKSDTRSTQSPHSQTLAQLSRSRCLSGLYLHISWNS